MTGGAIADAKILRPQGPANPLLALDFLERAREFMRAYETLPELGRPPEWPRYFLFCHAIELVLKAFLAYQGYSQKELIDIFGHDLEALLAKSIDLGLQLSAPQTRGNIGLLNEAHAKYWPRYPRETAAPVFVIEQFEPDAQDLFTAVFRAIIPMVPNP